MSIPEGATHKAIGPRIDCWYKNINCLGFEFMNQGGSEWLKRNGMPSWPYERIANEQPQSWSGPEDGLPPVNERVEVLWSSITGDYVDALILAHDEDRAVFRFVTGDRKGEYQADKLHFSGEFPNFRAIKTQDQIAAEKRETAIREIESVLESNKTVHASDGARKSYAETIYDAGFKREVV